MKHLRWKSPHGDTERMLRAKRPEASDELVRSLAAATAPRRARRPAVAFAAVLTTAFVVALAGFGGISYAAQAVQTAVNTATSTLSGSTTTVTTGGTPADWQYAGNHGCTPGYWKQTQHFFAWGSVSTSASFHTVFNLSYKVTGFDKNLTLLGALNLGGNTNGEALARHAVAAYLNSKRAGMNYPYSTAQVIAMVQNAYNSKNATTIENTKNLLEKANSLEGPLC
jgi:hypothetical protein